MPRVSVLMPVYNTCAEYLRPAIESILVQTFTDFEFIIINDGSTDNSPAVIAEYAAKDNRIKFIDNKKNSGLISVLNQGLDLCSGEYIARMDSDDIAYPERFAKQVEYLDLHPECGVLGTAIQLFGAQNKTCFYKKKITCLDLIYKCSVAHPSVMLRKNIFDMYSLRYNFEHFAAEDYGLWAEVIKYTQIHNLPEILLRYRTHPRQISCVFNAGQNEATKAIQQKLITFITDVPEFQDKLYKIALKSRLYDFVNLSGHMLLHHPISYFKLRKKLKEFLNG